MSMESALVELDPSGAQARREYDVNVFLGVLLTLGPRALESRLCFGILWM